MSRDHVLVLYSERDEDLRTRIAEHLDVLHHVGTLEYYQIELLAQKQRKTLLTKIGVCREAIILMSGAVLGSQCLFGNQPEKLFGGCRVRLIVGRACAWQLVPWLNELEVWPTQGGLLIDQDRDIFDQDLSALVYAVAQSSTKEDSRHPSIACTSVEAAVVGEKDTPAEAKEVMATADLDCNEDVEEIEWPLSFDITEPTAAEIQNKVAAGPADTEHSMTDAVGGIVAESIGEARNGDDILNEESCLQFDETCAAVQLAEETLSDEAISALLELGLFLGASRAEAGDEEGACRIYYHAAQQLVARLQPSGPAKHRASRFSRVVRLTIATTLKKLGEENTDSELVRRALELALERAPQLLR